MLKASNYLLANLSLANIRTNLVKTKRYQTFEQGHLYFSLVFAHFIHDNINIDLLGSISKTISVQFLTAITKIVVLFDMFTNCNRVK